MSNNGNGKYENPDLFLSLFGDKVAPVATTNGSSYNTGNNGTAFNVEDPGAVVGFLEGIRQREEDAAARAEQLKVDIKVIEAAVKRSTECTEWVHKVERQREMAEQRRKAIRQRVIALLLGAATTVSLGIGLFSDDFMELVESNKTREDALSRSVNLAQCDLDYNGLAIRNGEATTTDGRFVVLNNSVEGYKKLDVQSNDIVRIYAYMLLLNDTEFNDFIQAVNVNESAPFNLKPYANFEDYLQRNNFRNVSDFVEQAREATTKMFGKSNSGMKGR